jgi:hypothetical protein
MLGQRTGQSASQLLGIAEPEQAQPEQARPEQGDHR